MDLYKMIFKLKNIELNIFERFSLLFLIIYNLIYINSIIISSIMMFATTIDFFYETKNFYLFGIILIQYNTISYLYKLF